DRAVAEEERVLEVRPARVEVPPVRRRAVSEQERDAILEALPRRRAEQILQHRDFPREPVHFALRVEAAREEELEPAVVAEEMRVVERLRVVRVRARVEEKLDERTRLGVRRRGDRPGLADPDRARDRGAAAVADADLRAGRGAALEQQARGRTR